MHVRVKVCLVHLLFTKGQKYILGEEMKKPANNPKQTVLGLSVYFTELLAGHYFSP